MRSFGKSKKYRTASTHLEWAVAFIIFMSSVILTIKLSETHFLETYSTTISPDKVSLMMMNTISGLGNDVSSFQFRGSLCNASYYRTYFDVKNDSTIVCFQNAQLVPAYYRSSISRLEVSMNTTIPLVCIISNRISNYTCVSDIDVHSGTLENSKVVVQYTPTSINSIVYNGEELLAVPTSLPTTSIEKEEDRCGYGYVDFGNVSIELDAYSPRLWIKSTTPNNYTFTLRNIFTEYFDGTTTHTLSNGLNAELTTDILSLYGGGVAVSFIGKNMKVSMRVSPTQIKVSFQDIKKLEIVLCPTDYTCAICEKELFTLNELKMNAPIHLTVVPVEELEMLSEMSYEQLTQNLGITGYHFNITVANYSFGRSIPRHTNVWVRRFPITLLYKNGSMKVTTCTLSLWK